MAALAQFYSRLPSPDEHDQFLKVRGNEDHARLQQATLTLGQGAAGGVDHRFLTSRASAQNSGAMSMGLANLQFAGVDQVGCVNFWRSIAHLAMQKTPDQLSAETIEARQFRYYKWIARGHNNADVDMRLTGTGGTDEARHAAAHLPEETERGCCHCGNQPSTDRIPLYCAGCVIRSEDRDISCTYYCDSECQ